MDKIPLPKIGDESFDIFADLLVKSLYPKASAEDIKAIVNRFAETSPSGKEMCRREVNPLFPCAPDHP